MRNSFSNRTGVNVTPWLTCLVQVIINTIIAQ